ncbi:hypothetical protein [Bradyrhizobium sp. 45]|uniref:DUF1127 domain-containing protein n=1 Tax=Bradyrhizobium sp. 45 TaxID=1043587 RepID=UPI001FF73CF3|nr:hypothetical protein [Bradyrhizobium sp. 45]MCK1307659.1 hypothetical protein [Bradyrhizobium sp. 45]
MGVIHGISGLWQAATSSRRVASLFDRFMGEWWERRRRSGAQATLFGLSDRELMDIGTTRYEIDYLSLQRTIVRPHRSPDRYSGIRLVLLLFCCFTIAPTYETKAQCTAQDVLRNHLALKTAPPPGPWTSFRSPAEIPVWKTIAIGTFKDLFALRSAMAAMSCSAGGLADEALSRPAFTLSGKKGELELVVVSAAELGLQGETATLQNIYAHAQRLGLQLAPAEVAPQLRLQYLDQPIGEFLTVAMEPIRTWMDEAVIFTVANGGAGLILIGQDGHENMEAPTTSRFVFVRPKTPHSAESAAFAR